MNTSQATLSRLSNARSNRSNQVLPSPGDLMLFIAGFLAGGLFYPGHRIGRPNIIFDIAGTEPAPCGEESPHHDFEYHNNLEKKGKGLAAFPGILVYKAYLPRGFRCLGECSFLGHCCGTAETETTSFSHFHCAHCCRCFCIYLFCFYGRVSPTLTASALPCCPLPYSSPCRNLVIPIRSILATPTIKVLFTMFTVQYASGGDGGNRTLVQNAFQSASYSNIFT